MVLKLIIDFGLVVLIWMTQLVVYPSFTYFDPENLVKWHATYTTAIAIIVMPLMLAQLGMHGYGLTQQFTTFRVIMFVAILLTWINTFFFAVPLHSQIGSGNDVIAAAEKLVHINWYRTVLWTMVFAIGLYEHIKSSS